MSITFLKLMEGSRLTNYMGLEMLGGAEMKKGQGYLYLEIPFGEVEVDGVKTHGVVKRNQHVLLESSCKVNVKGNQVIEIEPNTQLAAWGQVQPSYKIHPQSGEQVPGVWFTARKDCDISDLPYLIRIYMYN